MKKSLTLVLFLMILGTVLTLGINASNLELRNQYTKEEWNAYINVNRERLNVSGLSPLSITDKLKTAADTRALEINQKGKVDHIRPSGKQWYTVLDDVEFRYNTVSSVAEIAARGKNYDSVLGAIMADSSSMAKLKSSSMVHFGCAVNNSPLCVLDMVLSECSIKNVALYKDGSDKMEHISAGTPIEEQNVFLELTCNHGTSYVPVIDKMYGGYDENVIGKQNVKFKYGSIGFREIIYNDFSDVVFNSWYYSWVRNAYEKGLFTGTSSIAFSPNTSMTRGMFVTVLAKVAKADVSNYTTSDFVDVEDGKWYTPYVCWAADKEIAAGTGNNQFSPNANVTREQLCLMIYKYVQVYKVNMGDNPLVDTFKDKSEIANWALEGVEYCRQKGIVAGDSNKNFNPKNVASRAEGAVIANKLYK